MNWTNEPIYLANERFGFDIDETNAVLYLKFFFFFVRGELGRFEVSEPGATLRWQPRAGSEVRARVEGMLTLTTFSPPPWQDSIIFTFTCIFKNALFRTDCFLALRPMRAKTADGTEQAFSIGQMELRNEDLLESNLPLFVPGPPTEWG